MSPSTSALISGVSGAPANRTTWTSGGSEAHARSRWGQPFCRVIRPTKTTDGFAGSTPAGQHLVVPSARPQLRVDAIVDDDDIGRVERGIGPQDVLPHPLAHRDDRRRRLVCRPLGE